MSVPSDPGRETLPGTVSLLTSRVLNVLVALIPGMVLLGWTLHSETLKRVLPGLVAMNPVSAICFLTLAAALWALRPEPGAVRMQRAGRACAGLVAWVSLLVLGRYLFGWHETVDRLMFHGSLGDNRMAPNTALAFLLTSVFPPASRRQDARRPSHGGAGLRRQPHLPHRAHRVWVRHQHALRGRTLHPHGAAHRHDLPPPQSRNPVRAPRPGPDGDSS